MVKSLVIMKRNNIFLIPPWGNLTIFEKGCVAKKETQQVVVGLEICQNTLFISSHLAGQLS